MSTHPYTEVVEPAEQDAVEELPAGRLDSVPQQATARRWYFGDGMGKRILGIVAFFLVLGMLWYAYKRHQITQANEGTVTIDDSGPRVADALPDVPAIKKVTNPVMNTPAPVSMTPAAPVAIPASDSIAPNPTNGMTFAGTGKFQVYRQGNLTWRVDTESGQTCILFATMEEWKKPLVYQHGCANS